MTVGDWDDEITFLVSVVIVMGGYFYISHQIDKMPIPNSHMEYCVDVRFGSDECYRSFPKARQMAGSQRVYEQVKYED